jgi:hypothetical protein
MFDEHEELEAQPVPEMEFVYRGSAFTLIFWLAWSVVGYLFLVFSKYEEGLLEMLYLVSTIASVMALHNRKHGLNHRIVFYPEYMIVPKILNIWLWYEEKIYYKDINEINFIDHARLNEKGYCEIELRTDFLRYPILGRKLDMQSFGDVYKHLLQKTKMDGNEMPKIEENGAPTFALKPWQKKLGAAAVIISVWAILIIGLAEKYVNIVYGGQIFFLTFILSFGIVYFVSRKITDVTTKGQKWQKYFLLFYLGFYGGIGGAFSLVYLNGVLDSSEIEKLEMVVENEKFYESNKGRCVELSFVNGPPGGADGRSPASAITRMHSNVFVCNKDFQNLKKGDIFMLHTHDGIFGERWVSKVERIEK